MKMCTTAWYDFMCQADRLQKRMTFLETLSEAETCFDNISLVFQSIKYINQCPFSLTGCLLIENNTAIVNVNTEQNSPIFPQPSERYP